MTKPANRYLAQGTVRAVIDASLAWIVQRVALAAFFGLGALLYGSPGHSPSRPDNPWINWWDTGQLLFIAQHNYGHPLQTVFDPLYPLTIRLLAGLAGGHYTAAASLIANLACFGALLGLRILGERELGLPGARWALAFFAFQPTAMYMAMAYTESLFLMLAIAAFLLVRAGSWRWAGDLTLLATFTRGVGLLLLVPFAVEALARAAEAKAGRLRLLAVAAVSAAIPLLAYLGFRAYLGAEFGMSQLRAERVFFSRYADWPWVGPLQALGLALRHQFTGPGLNAAYDLAITAFFGALTLLLFLRRRLPISYALYSGAGYVALLALPMHDPIVGEDLNGLPRYLMLLFPVWIGLADWAADKRWRQALALGLCLVGFAVSVIGLGHPPFVM